MKLSDTCIRRPVLSIVISLVLIVLGVVGFQRLQIRFFPQLNIPMVTVSTSYSGASANLMENQVTTPLENAIAGVEGIKYMSSSSRNGSSRITVMFNLGGDFEAEASQVRDKVASAMQNLPTDVNRPVVSIGSSGGNVISYSITQKGKTSAELRDYVTHKLSPQFRQLPGVAGVGVNGAWDYAMRVWLNAEKMAALGVSADDVETAIDENNIYFPAGSFRTVDRDYGVVSDTQLGSAKQFGNIVLSSGPDGTVRLKDVAKVELGYTTPFPTPLYVDGKQAVILNVAPVQTANPITVAQEAKQQMQIVLQQIPKDMKIKVMYDKSLYLQDAINETFKTIGEAIILVILVSFLFLGSLRAASVPIVTIPVSMIAVFFVLYLFGFSVNMMSLLGIVLAIGLVVDDAIVMMENIHRHIENGLSPYKAAFKGSREIATAVIAMAITLAAVYAPIGFASGITSKLFQQFAFTLAGAVVISGFVALTLSPMMCSKVLPAGHVRGRYAVWLENLFDRLSAWYKKMLAGALKIRHLMLLIAVVIAGLGYVLFANLSSEFIPKEDYGMIGFSVTAPSGSTPQYVARYLNQIEGAVKTIPAIKDFGYQLLSGNLLSFFTLAPWQQRKMNVEQIAAALNKQFAKIPGITITASVPEVINYGSSSGAGFSLYLMTAGNYRDLLPYVDKVVALLKNYPGLTAVDTNLKFNAQQYGLHINRDLAAATGVSLQSIADTVHTLMSGNHWTDVQSGSDSYDVLVQMRKQDMLGFRGLDKLYIAATPPATATTTSSTPSSDMIPLSSLITLTPQIGQNSLIHYNRLRAASVTATLSPGYTMSDVVNYVQANIHGLLSPEIHYAYSGRAQQYLESAGSIAGIFLLAFIFIYLVLSAQFGSFIDPFIILFAVPLSIVGALLFLWLVNGTLNLYSEIGMVTLVGMISKHGILITQFINAKRREGLELYPAIIEAASVRLRPILMTTAAMVFGVLPLALAVGPGSNGREQIGWVIVGGLLCGTFFSLVLVPIAYSYFGALKRFKEPEAEE